MNILVTGAKGFVGKNLCANLRNIKEGKDRRFPELSIGEIYEYDLGNTQEELDVWCRECDFVFNLAGVNRPKDASEFMEGNFGFASTLLDTLKKHGNRCPVMLSSSQQASLTGRFGNSEYGRSKKAGEDLFLRYEQEFLRSEEGFKGFEKFKGLRGLRPRVLIYRFPNVFGKWCRPNYNSAVATFCNAVANDLPYTVNDPAVELELLYIDDLVQEMLNCLEGKEHRCDFEGLEVIPAPCPPKGEIADGNGRSPLGGSGASRSPSGGSGASRSPLGGSGAYCYCPVTHKVTLGRIVELLHLFAEQPKTLMIPEIPEGSFEKKLYSTYLSYLPKEKVAFPLKMNVDDRGSFTELVHTLNCGQVSINISKPGITKGQHWHNTKWEFFIVVSGHGLIQQRNLNDPEGKVLEWEVNGDKIEAVHMLPGYTHNIINLSETEDLVTVMYCNEVFDASRPDTFFEPV